MPGSHSETYVEQNELGNDLPDSDLFGAGAFDGVHLGRNPLPDTARPPGEPYTGRSASLRRP